MERARQDTRRGGSQPQGCVCRRCGLAVAILALVFIGTPAFSRAQFTRRDGQIIARTLSFVEPRREAAPSRWRSPFLPTGSPDRPASLGQAESLLAVIGRGLHVGYVTL